MKKKLGILITVSMVVGLLTGCGVSTTSEDPASAAGDTAQVTEVTNEEGKQTTMTFMDHTSEEAKVAWEDSVIGAFEEAHPGVKIEVQRMGYDDYIQTLQTKFASGDAPDIYALENTYMEKYIDNGYVASLDGTDLASRFDDGALDMLSVDGKLYAIPNTAQVMDVTYNKDVFEQCGIKEIPTTLDEFYAVCKMIQDAGIVPIGAAYSETWCLMADLQADYIANVLTNDSNAIIDVQNRDKTFAGNEAWAGVLQRIQDRLVYTNADPFGLDWNNACTMMANGEVAMILNGNWTPNNVLAMNENANLGSFPLPTTNNAEDTKFVVQSPTEGLALNAESTNLDLAKEFLAFYTSEDAVNSFVSTNNEICIVKGADTSKAQGALKDVMDQIDAGNVINLGAVDHNFTNEYRDAIQTVVSESLLNGMTVEDTLAELDVEFDRIAGK